MLTHNDRCIIGSPVYNERHGKTGHIVGLEKRDCQSFVIGAAMEPILHDLTIVWADGSKSITPDAIAKPWQEEAQRRGLAFCDDPAELLDAANALEAQARTAARLERDTWQEQENAFKAELLKLCPAGAKAAIIAELEQDDSDSMSDYFNTKTTRRVILGFSNHTRDLFPELRKFAARFTETAHLATAGSEAEHREKYSMGAGYYLKASSRYSSGWTVSKSKFYGGQPSCQRGEFHLHDDFADVAKAAPVPAETAGRFTIEEHTHTKKGFQMFICIMADRVERAEFDTLRANAEAMGGWYSRAWGRTPGGFAFKDRATAEAFAGTGTPSPTPPSNESATPAKAAPSQHMADKLDAIADTMQEAINNAFRDRLSNTPKRARQAAEARLDGNQWERAQKAARALANAHRAGTVPPELAGVATKSKIHDLAKSVIDRSNCGYYDAGRETGKPYYNTPQALALWAMLGGRSEADQKADALLEELTKLQFANIEGYFPTPPEIVEKMIDRADLEAGQTVLEPSAGSGNILDALKGKGLHLYFCEVSPRLQAVLKLKGYHAAGYGGDFMEHTPEPIFDRVLMNPPFERGQDMEHVRRAFEHLKPGGRLVAIMSPGPFFRSDAKAQAFRAWFDDLGGDREDIAAGAFKQSGTGVATVLVELRK